MAVDVAKVRWKLLCTMKTLCLFSHGSDAQLRGTTGGTHHALLQLFGASYPEDHGGFSGHGRCISWTRRLLSLGLLSAKSWAHERHGKITSYSHTANLQVQKIGQKGVLSCPQWGQMSSFRTATTVSTSASKYEVLVLVRFVLVLVRYYVLRLPS